MAARHFNRAITAYRAAITAPDSATIDATFLTNIPKVLVDQDNLPIHARFTQAGDSMVVTLVATWADSDGVEHVLGVSDPVTLTAGTEIVAGKYLAPFYTHPGFGAYYARLRVVTAPAASAELWVGTY